MPYRVLIAALTLALGLGTAAFAAESTVENLDFSLKVESASWTSTGFVLRAVVENRTGSTELFLHHEPGRDDAEAFLYAPSAASAAPVAGRRTFTLKGLKESRTGATLAFGLGPEEAAGLLVVGELRAPHRQVAIALKDLLPARPVTAARPAPAENPSAENPATETRSAETPGATETHEPGVIRAFTPPHASFGSRILLKEGHAGPPGEGWVRIYTELPDVTLDQLARVLEQPAQIWRGDAGWLYLRNIGGTRALAIEVRDASVISARYVTPQTLGQVVGPKTRHPKRVYMGRP